jgi:hypothetical protein
MAAPTPNSAGPEGPPPPSPPAPPRPLGEITTVPVPTASPSPGPADDADAETARAAMVDRLHRGGDLTAGAVADALRALPRQSLMPQAYVRRGAPDETPPRWELRVGAPLDGSLGRVHSDGDGTCSVTAFGPRAVRREIEETAARWRAAGEPDAYRAEFDTDGTQWAVAGHGRNVLRRPLRDERPHRRGGAA